MKKAKGIIEILAIVAMISCFSICEVYAAEPIERKVVDLIEKSRYDQLDSIMDGLEKTYKNNFLKEEDAERSYLAFHRTNPDHEKYYNQWISLKPDSPYAYLARAEYFHSMGWKSRGGKFADETTERQFSEMRDFFRKSGDDVKEAMKLNDQIIHSYLILIQTFKAISLDAKPFVQKSLKINPYSLKVRQAYLVNLLPRWGGSIKDMETFISEARPYNKKNPGLKVLEGRVLVEKGDQARIFEKDYDKALELYEAALKYGDSFGALKSKAWILARNKKYVPALDAYERALHIEPFDVDLLAGIARYAYYTGDKQKAFNAAAEILKIDPNHAEAHNLMGLSYKEQGKNKDAEREFRQALEIRPTEKAYKKNLDSVLP